jgi:hypothetical protein
MYGSFSLPLSELGYDNRGKWLKETRLGVSLLNNSSFLNGDVGIMDLVILNFSKQIIVSLSLSLPSILLSSSIVLPHYIL